VCAVKAWDLFVIVASSVPASARAAADVRAHHARQSRSRQTEIAEAAQFAYIRFCARCAIGEAAVSAPVSALIGIAKESAATAPRFGASVYEQLWAQRRARPRLPIPVLLHVLALAVTENGAETTEGVFRRSGNARRVQDLIAAVNGGAEPAAALARADVHDVASAMKQWFAMLPERIVDAGAAERLATVYEGGKDYRGFVESLPRAHASVLKFLCGFLQHLALSSPLTKMDGKNLAIVFAPAVVAQLPQRDQFAVMRHTVVSQEFMSELLQKTDNRELYPIPDELT
jgi:hypothetical protein